MVLDIYPRGDSASNKDFVSVHIRLLSSVQRCYSSQVKLGILSTHNILKRKLVLPGGTYGLTEKLWTISQYASSPAISLDTNEGLLHNGNLNVVVEAWCGSLLTHSSKQSLVPATENKIEINKVWTVYNLSLYFNMSDFRTCSVRFPSNSDLSTFTLAIIPYHYSETISSARYFDLQVCADNIHSNRPNGSLLVREHVNLKECKETDIQFNLFDRSPHSYVSGLCILYTMPHDVLLRKQCFTVIYSGIYLNN